MSGGFLFFVGLLLFIVMDSYAVIYEGISLFDLDKVALVSPDSLRSLYINEGYWMVKMNRVGDTVRVNEGELVCIEGVDVVGDSSYSLSLFDGMPASARILNDIPDYIVNYWANRGYPFAKARYDSGAVMDSSAQSLFARLYISLQRGDIVFISGVLLSDKLSLSNRALWCWMLFPDGDVLYSRMRVDGAIARVNRIGIVKIEGIPLIGRSEDGRWFLMLDGAKRETSTAQGILSGYQKDGSFKLGGSVNIAFVNPWRWGRSFAFGWERLTPEREKMMVAISDPSFIGSRYRLTGSFEYLSESEQYTTLKWDFSVDYPINYTATLTDGIGFTRTEPGSLGVRMGYPRESGISVSTGMELNSLNDVDEPTSGWYLSGDATGYRRSIEEIELPSETTAYEASAVIIGKKPISVGIFTLFMSAGFRGYLVSSRDTIPYPSLFRLGGLTTVRGYLQGQFSDRDIVYAQNELRLWLGEDLACYPFIDWGYSGSSGHILGYGVGVLTKTPIGMLSVSYGASLERGIWNGLVHFGVSSGF